MIALIENIPNSKLEGGIGGATIRTDHRNFRLDNQGVSYTFLSRTINTC